jgi:hypothetical protein
MVELVERVTRAGSADVTIRADDWHETA